MKIKLLFILTLLTKFIFSQEDSVGQLKVNGYIDTYYAYEFSNPSSRTISYAYNHNRQNEFNINNVIIFLQYKQNKLRANLSLHAGTYVVANYAPEPTLLQPIYEATVGFQVAKRMWVDAGIMPSHLGFESPISKGQWALTRSLSAENSPYYESGVKLTFSPNDKWKLAALLLNGWQNINENNTNKAPALQVVFTPNEKLLINYSSFWGEGQNLPDSLKLMRHFHDFYSTYLITKRFSTTLLFDFGFQQKSISDKSYAGWFATTLFLRYKIDSRFTTCFRADYYSDPNGIIIGKKVAGFSLNLDYAPIKNVLLRGEIKTFPNSDSSGNLDENSFVKSLTTISMAASF